MLTFDGTIYHGGFKNGQFSGQGFYITPSGYHFIGRFKKNLKVDEGVTFYSDGNKEACFYNDDICQGMAAFILKYGNSFQYVYDNGNIANPEQFKKDLLVAMKHGGHNPKDGCIWGNCENGLGMIMNNMVESYIGYFVNGEKSGFGQFRYVSDNISYASYLDDKKYGIEYFYNFKKGKKFKIH